MYVNVTLLVKLEINTLGTEQDRVAYRNALATYFEQHRSSLSDNSQLRLQRKSVLRILDSKDDVDQQIVSQAPKIYDYLSSASQKRFEGVLEALTWLQVPYVLNPFLVRGLDYYSHTTFEFKGKSESMGTQSTVLAGGRYDDLVRIMGGPATPSIGWACGVERYNNYWMQ